MMDNFKKDMISIIGAALSGVKNLISEDFDLEKGIKTARNHNILSIFYEGCILCGISPDNSLLSAIGKELYMSVLTDARQMSMVNQLTKIFEDEHIDFLPLKGIILKSLYPKSEMRAMGDADILIKLEHYLKISKILTDLNFDFKYESDHELVWSNPSLYLELHKSVMTSYNKDFYSYFGTGWSLAKKVAGTNSKYEFSPEDFYIYIFVHFAKHYRISGIGIKHILDLWVYKTSYPKMNFEYIVGVLEKLKLAEFYKNVIDTLDVWFSHAPSNQKTDLITNLIFTSGQYGTAEMTIINSAIRDSKNTGSIGKSKRKNLLKVIVPPHAVMKKKYPILKVLPFLLPFMWMVRWVNILVYKRKDITRYMDNAKTINKSTVDEHQFALNFVGLDFNFKE